MYECMAVYQNIIFHKQNTGVRLEVDTIGLFDYLESFDCNVGLIAKT
jgi:hypothetical protein